MRYREDKDPFDPLEKQPGKDFVRLLETALHDKTPVGWNLHGNSILSGKTGDENGCVCIRTAKADMVIKEYTPDAKITTKSKDCYCACLTYVLE